MKFQDGREMVDVLVDTSVWVDFLRSGDPNLAILLENMPGQNRVVIHPMIIGEL